MAAGMAARAGARIGRKVAKKVISKSKKGYSKTSAGKKAATRKRMEQRARARAEGVKQLKSKRAIEKRMLSDDAWGTSTRMTPRKRPGSSLGPRKNGVRKVAGDKNRARDQRKAYFLADEAAKGKPKLPSIKKTPAVRQKSVVGGPSQAARKLAADTNRAKAARLAARRRARRRAAVVGGGLSAAAVTARRRRSR